MMGIQILDQVSEDKAIRIQALQISGIDLIKYSQRHYPQGEIFSNLIGFVNDDNVGSAGLELHLENQIKVLKKSNLIKKEVMELPYQIIRHQEILFLIIRI